VAFLIELFEVIIEFALLLHTVEARGTSGFRFEGEMHTLMPAILLWMTGLDALDGEAQTQPPHRKLGEVEQRVGRGERHAIVGTDADGQAALLKQARKGRKCKGFAGRFQSLTEEEKARGVIGDGIVPFRWVPGAMEFAAMPSPVSSIARRDAFRDAFVMSARQVTFLDTLLSALTPFLSAACRLPAGSLAGLKKSTPLQSSRSCLFLRDTRGGVSTPSFSRHSSLATSPVRRD
jgi:hypothetical protein